MPFLFYMKFVRSVICNKPVIVLIFLHLYHIIFLFINGHIDHSIAVLFLVNKILTLSSTAAVNLINGLFDTDYDTESIITYIWTEFENEDLKRVLADTILTINGKYSYHLEAQMTEDETIILRVFDYGYGYAGRTATEEEGVYRLKFPEPKIIYLYSEKYVSDEYRMELDFGIQGTFMYKVSTYKFQEISTQELNDKKMVILIPFMLLRVRKIMEKERSASNLEMLKKLIQLIQNDIIRSINRNLEVGNITVQDAQKLKRYTHKLYEHIYSHYEEMEELNEMTDESLMLDVDIIEKKHEEEMKILEKELKEIIAEKDKEIEKLKTALINAGTLV